MSIKENNMLMTRRKLGWAYYDMKWLTQEQASQANKDREKLIASFPAGYQYSFKKSKLHTGKLSPGCLICGEGNWSCLFINHPCTANCFFCPQDRQSKDDHPPRVMENLDFVDPKDYVEFLKRFGYRGTGISGGESLLDFDKLLAFIKEMRTTLGRQYYIWIYTNGDLLEDKMLTLLADSGLDEIRFNIYPSEYALDKLEMAVGRSNAVTVEIPAIPEDIETLLQLMQDLDEIGIDYLNLHELITTQFNYRDYIKRDYVFLHHPPLPVYESGQTGLEAFHHALKNDIKTPINYCTSFYKSRFQGKGVRLRYAPLVCKKHESLTESGFIRCLGLRATPPKLEQIVNILNSRGDSFGLWAWDEDHTEVFIHPSLLDKTDIQDCSLNLVYYSFSLESKEDPSDLNKKITLASGLNYFINRNQQLQKQLKSIFAIRCFEQIYIKGQDPKAAIKNFCQSYELTSKKAVAEMQREKEIILDLRLMEKVEDGFLEIY